VPHDQPHFRVADRVSLIEVRSAPRVPILDEPAPASLGCRHNTPPVQPPVSCPIWGSLPQPAALNQVMEIIDAKSGLEVYIAQWRITSTY
jgi:hypothetical protein